MLFVTETQYQYKLGKQSQLCNGNVSSVISVFGITAPWNKIIGSKHTGCALGCETRVGR
jgi:hypothetical protein